MIISDNWYDSHFNYQVLPVVVYTPFALEARSPGTVSVMLIQVLKSIDCGLLSVTSHQDAIIGTMVHWSNAHEAPWGEVSNNMLL
jgi:hypothetical protein